MLRRKALGALEDAAARVTKTCGATPQRHDDSHVLETGGRGVGFHVRPLRSAIEWTRAIEDRLRGRGASRTESYEEPDGTATRTAPARTARMLGNGKRVSVSYCTQEQEEAGFGVGSMSVSKTKGEQ